jgi:glycosyltransferase involved in cell wall biosynthesis
LCLQQLLSSKLEINMMASMAEERAILDIRLLTEGDPGQLTGGYLYQRQLAKAAASHGARIDFLSVKPGLFAKQIAETRSILRRTTRADVLVVDSIVMAAAAPWISETARRVPVIGIAHQQAGGTDHGLVRTVLQKKLDLLGYRRCTAIVAVSEWLATRLMTVGLTQERISVVPPGLDGTAAWSIASVDLRQGRQAAALCVANWRRNKGIDLLIEAVSSFDSRLLTLHLVGNTSVDPAYERTLRARLRMPDLRDRVVVHGAIAPRAVHELMGSADFLVHPSRHEAYGAVVAEAMAAGLPVVGFSVDNLPYLVRDGLDGMLAPAGDCAALARALRLMVENPRSRADMADSAAEHARQFPSWSETADRFFSFLHFVCDPRQNQTPRQP